MSEADDAANAPALLRSMQTIRAFEDALMRLPKPGFQLLSAGEEAVAVGVCAALEDGDQLLSSGRSIGPALARGVTPAAVMCELRGKVTGPCRGRGGRGHLSHSERGFFGAHAVVGGNLTVAAGVALALQRLSPGRVAVCLFGDGACGAGALHETLNLAALWRLPLVLVCCNNQYSVSTRVEEGLAPRPLSDLARPFGVPGRTVDGMDALAVRAAMRDFVGRARGCGRASSNASPTASPPTRRPPRRPGRPRRLTGGGRAARSARSPAGCSRGALLDAESLDRMEREVRAEIAAAVAAAEAAPYPDVAEGGGDGG